MGRLGWFLGGLGFAAAVARFVRGDRGTAVAPPPAPSLPPPPVAVSVPPAPARPEPIATPEPEPAPEPELSIEAQPDEPAPEPLTPPEPGDEEGVDPRAEELRRRLDESRTLVEEREEFESGETTVDNVDVAVATRDLPDPDERRRQIHEEGQGVIDRMKGEPA